MDIIPIKFYNRMSDVEFGCDWQGDTCIGLRKHLERGLPKVPKLCCRGCAANRGYFRLKPHQELPEEYKSYWDDKDGFFREGTGCSLPKEMRSTRCLVYVCNDANISQENREKLLQIEQEYMEEKPWLLTQTAT